MAPPVAADGLPARSSQPYAQEKLYYLQRYLDIVSKAMRAKWPLRAFVDLMAGPGRCVIEGKGVEFDGSPIVALNQQPPFTHIALAESSSQLVAALRQRVAAVSTTATVEILEADCNAADTIARIRSFVPASALTIVFVDMLGADVAFETLQALTRDRKMDLLITFQVGDLRRNVGDALVKPTEGARLDRFFGSPEWRSVAQRPGDPVEALTTHYEDRLAVMGYPFVGRSLDVMTNSKNAQQYRLLLASKNPKGPEFFEKVASISYEGKRRLF